MKGTEDYPLDTAGKSQTKNLAQEIAAYKPDVVISSPLRRAKEPAKAIAQAAKVPLHISDKFLPIDLGAMGGTDSEKGEKELSLAARNSPDKPVAKGGESFNRFLKKKVRPGFQDVKRLIAQGKRPVVVTHSRNLREIRHGMFGEKPVDPATGFTPQPGGYLTMNSLKGKRLMEHNSRKR